jgi:Uma2 family endonuclease
MTGFSEDNAPAYEPPMSKAAFLRWVQRQERRYELKDGRTIMQAGVSRNHARLVAKLLTALTTRLDPDVWAVTASDLAVEIGDDIRYPDVMVERLGGDGSALSTELPVVLVEVLSPSSVATDMTVKLAEYTSLASLEAYIVASQDEPILWVWQRDAASRAFPSKPQQIDGRDQSLAIAALAITLPLAQLYRGIATA